MKSRKDPMDDLTQDLRYAVRNGRATAVHCSSTSPAILVMVAHVVCASFLQAQEIRVGEPAVVASAPDQRLFAEPHLVVHPAQPNYLLAAVMVWPPVGGSHQERVSRLKCAAFVSVDGGSTWEQHDFPVTNCFDPWVAITPDGRGSPLRPG